MDARDAFAELAALGLIAGIIGYGIGVARTEARTVAEPSLRERREAAYLECFAGRVRGSTFELAPDAIGAAEEGCLPLYDEGPDCGEECQRLQFLYDVRAD